VSDAEEEEMCKFRMMLLWLSLTHAWAAQADEVDVLRAFEEAKVAMATCSPDLADRLHPVELSPVRGMAFMLNHRIADADEAQGSQVPDISEAMREGYVDETDTDLLRLFLDLRANAVALRGDTDDRILAGILCRTIGRKWAHAIDGLTPGIVLIEGDAALIEIQKEDPRSRGALRFVREGGRWRAIDLLELAFSRSEPFVMDSRTIAEDAGAYVEAERARHLPDPETEVLREQLRALPPAPFVVSMIEFGDRMGRLMTAGNARSDNLRRLDKRFQELRMARGDGAQVAQDAVLKYYETRYRHDDEDGDAEVEFGHVVEALVLAAEGGDTKAQSILGRLHADDHWLPVDLEASRAWHKRAAESGNASSALELARAHYGWDSDLVIDCVAALKWLEIAQTDDIWGNAGEELAWVLATCPDPALRDGKRALLVANETIASKQAVFGDDHTPGQALQEALAAAYCEIGEYDLAVLAMDQILDRRTCGFDPAQLKRREMYAKGECWRGPRN
jgi:hypothetical protein